MRDSFGKYISNKVHKRGGRPVPEGTVFRKVPADSVPYGESISHNGRTVWVALVGNRVLCVAATSKEVRRKFYEIRDTSTRVWG